MKKTLSLLLVTAFILCAFAACGGSANYLSWKADDYTNASDTEKFKCAEAYTNAILKAAGTAEISGDELTASATSLMPVLEANLAQFPDKTVQDIIDMSVSMAAAADGEATAGAAAE